MLFCSKLLLLFNLKIYRRDAEYAEIFFGFLSIIYRLRADFIGTLYTNTEYPISNTGGLATSIIQFKQFSDRIDIKRFIFTHAVTF